MSPSIDRLIERYGDPYRKSDRIEIGPERFRKAIDRGDDGAWGVGALVAHDERGLFVREGGTWLLPGGRLEPGESPESGARREVCEETGIDVEIADLGAIAEQTFVDRDSENSYEFTFATFVATPTDPSPRLSGTPDEPSIDEVSWFSTVPEETFDRDLVCRLFDAYI